MFGVLPHGKGYAERLVNAMANGYLVAVLESICAREMQPHLITKRKRYWCRRCSAGIVHRSRRCPGHGRRRGTAIGDTKRVSGLERVTSRKLCARAKYVSRSSSARQMERRSSASVKRSCAGSCSWRVSQAGAPSKHRCQTRSGVGAEVRVDPAHIFKVLEEQSR